KEPPSDSIMKTNLLHSLVALLALGFVTGTASAAPKSQVKARGTIDLNATLQPTADAPAGVTASAAIVVSKPKFNQDATATLTLTGPSGQRGRPPSTNPVVVEVVSQSSVQDSVEKARHFLWVAFGAPASTALTINVDGVAVGTVTSTGRGKVMFHELDASV